MDWATVGAHGLAALSVASISWRLRGLLSALVSKMMRQLRVHRAADQLAHQLLDQAPRPEQILRLAVPLQQLVDELVRDRGATRAPSFRRRLPHGIVFYGQRLRHVDLLSCG